MSQVVHSVDPGRVPVIERVEDGVFTVDGVTVAATIISCVQREEARSVTVPQFEALGITPRVFLSPCKPAGPDGNAEVTHRAVLFAKVRGLPLLFVEDDVDLSGLFLPCLGEAVRRDVLTYFYTHDDEGMVRERFPDSLAGKVLSPDAVIAPGLYKRRRQGASMVEGSQCVFIPASLVQELKTEFAINISRFRPGYGAWSCDVTIMNSATHSRHWPFIALPNPVQHRHDRTARDNVEALTFKRSLTFERPIVEVSDE